MYNKSNDRSVYKNTEGTDAMNIIKRLLQKENIRTLVYVLYSFVCTLLFPLFVSDNSLAFSNSAFSLLLFFAMFLLLKAEGKREGDSRRAKYTHILGLLFSMMTAFGYSLDTYGNVAVGRLLVPVILYTHVFAVLLSFIWRLLEKGDDELNRPAQGFTGRIERIISWLAANPVVLALIIIAAWLPAFLADFPGGFRYDATSEFNQSIYGYEGDFPLLHSAIITKLLPFCYNLTGSYNTGVAVYTGLQMLMISAMYTHMLCVMAERKVNCWLLLAAFLYMAFFPTIQILVVQVVRDVLFSALLMYSVFLLYLINADKDRFFSNYRNPVLFSLVLTLTILARNNNAGLVAVLIITILGALLWLQNRKKYMGGATVLTVSLIAFYLLISLSLKAVCQPYSEPSANGSLSLASQCIARAYIDNQHQMSAEEKELFSNYLDVEAMKYVAENADGTKGELRNPAGIADFAAFFIRTGLKYPSSYFNAVMANTQNMWFPPSVVDGYNQMYKINNELYLYRKWDKCYYLISTWQEEPARYQSLLPNLLSFYSKIGLQISFEKIPIISMLFSIGFQFWILLNCLFYNLYRKNRKLILPLCILMLYMVLSAFGPLVLLRYYAAIFFCFPLLLVFTLQPASMCKDNN